MSHFAQCILTLKLGSKRSPEYLSVLHWHGMAYTMITDEHILTTIIIIYYTFPYLSPIARNRESSLQPTESILHSVKKRIFPVMN